MKDRTDQSARVLKQPREDVVGIQRDDWLLSLEDEALAHQDALIRMAHHLHTACLVGNPAPVVRDMYERISHPQVGDLVVEHTAFWASADEEHRTYAFGYLVEHREEWWQTDEEWQASLIEEAEVGGDPDQLERLTDDAWYVQYGPAPVDICRWTNCSFVTLPIDIQSFR